MSLDKREVIYLASYVLSWVPQKQLRTLLKHFLANQQAAVERTLSLSLSLCQQTPVASPLPPWETPTEGPSPYASMAT